MGTVMIVGEQVTVVCFNWWKMRLQGATFGLARTLARLHASPSRLSMKQLLTRPPSSVAFLLFTQSLLSSTTHSGLLLTSFCSVSCSPHSHFIPLLLISHPPFPCLHLTLTFYGPAIMVSPRRSSRARSTANPAPVSHSSSSSSTSSNRGRLQKHHDNDSHGDHDIGHSRRGDHGGIPFESHLESTAEVNGTGDDEIDDAGSQEDEVTRCICGHQEYQGGDDDQADSDGLFIQCDQCHVWQHGFCVGITDTASTPENYYCERCKPELHKSGTSKSGMRTSLYLPVHSEPSSPINNKEIPHKRRTTMNSRDAEYDDAILKKVLEESKNDKLSGSSRGTSSRSRKRGTSEGSDEPKQDSKRRRTSDSPDTPVNGPIESSDEKSGKGITAPSSTKKSRGTSSRHSNINSSATGKRTSTRNRNGDKNKEARKEDEYPPPRSNNRATNKPVVEEVILPPPVTETAPDTPQQPAKRSARNGNTSGHGGRRRGNYRHRQSEDPGDNGGASPHVMTRDHSSAGGNQGSKPMDHGTIIDKPTKPRIPQARMSINEMGRRVRGISDFITRTQIEMASSRASDIYAYLAWMEEKGTPVSNATTPQNPETPTSSSSGDKTLPQIQINGNGTGKILEKAVEALSSNIQPGALEMMELLSSKINRWQQQYGEKV
ncbi:hypothetical protein B9Z19DRAFT_1103607 [Tuber borchii]|uniref:PHD-type domain-containing protein n=1 Tax=Tuber borchii TaxID=42251 RepID=A0A2T6ZFE6_TUBBO|nr:hypothetical protein B9Z19DRAFT_1103607 [Tuber borchii]